MFHVIGIDQSVLHTGVCIINHRAELQVATLIEPKKLKDTERLAFIRDSIKQITSNYSFRVGLLEGYSYNSVNKKFLLGEVGSIIKLALYDSCEDMFAATPKELKKFVAEKGSATKDDIKSAVKNRWGMPFKDDNLADAYGLARIALEIAQPTTTNRKQLDVIKKLTTTFVVKEKRLNTKLFKDAL